MYLPVSTTSSQLPERRRAFSSKLPPVVYELTNKGQASLMCTSSRRCTRGIWCMCPTVLLMPSWDPWWHFFGYLLHLRKSCPSWCMIQKDSKTVGFCSPFGTCPGFMPFVQVWVVFVDALGQGTVPLDLGSSVGLVWCVPFWRSSKDDSNQERGQFRSVRKSSKLLNAPQIDVKLYINILSILSPLYYILYIIY